MVLKALTAYERLRRRSRLRFPYDAQPLSAEGYRLLSSRAGWSAARAAVAPGIELRGLLRRPRAAGAAPWVLFYPGNDPAPLRSGQDFLERLAKDLDWGLALFAPRGYDSSDGTPELPALATDAPAVLSQLCQQADITPGRAHLVGFSIGGHFAVQAARAAALQGQRTATLSLLASVNDIVMLRRSPWMKLSRGDDYQTQPLLADLPAPVLVLQGGADLALHGPSQGRAIAAALGSKATYREQPGVGHEALLEDEPALSAIRDFIAASSR